MKQIEMQGIPAIFLASSEFQQAAQDQGQALGLEPDVVYVAHPIQDRTDEGLQALADQAFDQVLARLTA